MWVTLHKRKGVEKLWKQERKYTMKKGPGSISPEQESLYRTTGHASFGSFGGVDDDLTEPPPTLFIQRSFTRYW